MVAIGAVRAAYVVLFGLSAVACLAGVARLSRIRDPDTRRGLGALLLLSAAWAAAQVGYLVVPDPRLAVASHTVGLVVGLSTVGAWLYFCSAYADRSYHRDPRYRWAGVVVFLAVVAFKLTNPWHALYFETAVVTTPFRHVTIREQPAFWVVAGTAYVLSAAGFVVLAGALARSRAVARGTGLVVALAALPVGLDVVGYLAPAPVLGLNYESVGVGLFALGALYVVREPFFAAARYGRAQLVDGLDDAVLIVDADWRVREYNSAAVDLFPELSGRDAPHIDEVTDADGGDLVPDGGAVELTHDGETRYFVVRTTPVAVGATEVGHSVVWTDVTEIERQRRELRRKDDQLEGFASAITHELRNSVGIVGGQAELLARSLADRDDTEAQSRAETIRDEAAEMERVVDELQTLARYGQRIDETAVVDVGGVARSAKRRGETTDLRLEVDRPVEVTADEGRLSALFRRAFAFADQHGASTVVVRGRDDGFVIDHDGRSLAGVDEDDLLAYGNAVPDKDTAMLLPNVRMLAATHGWTVSVETDCDDGVRVAVEGAEVGSDREN